MCRVVRRLAGCGKEAPVLCEVGPKRRELKLKLSAISTFLAPQLMRSDDVPLAIFRDAVFLQCLRVRNNETTFLLREMNAIEGRDAMVVEDDTAGYRDQKYIPQSADSEHFLIANYHTTDFCTYEIRVYRVRIFYLT
jgi:hypothetical protein